MLNIEEPQPTLLAERQSDHAAELDQFGLGELAMHAIPEGIVSVEPPDNGFGISKRRFLTFIVFCRLFEVQKVEHVLFD